MALSTHQYAATLLSDFMAAITTLLGLLFLTCISHGLENENQPRVFRRTHIESSQVQAQYKSIFSFGDSIADTGNYVYYSENKHPCGYLPYGETYFRKATGRCSDGRLIINFIAKAYVLPWLKPYLKYKDEAKNFSQGVNFAVAGATAIDASFFKRRGVSIVTNFSLGVQLEWFKQLLPSLCSSPSECQNTFKDSLFFIGEIGGNDLNLPLFQARRLEEIKQIAPKTVAAISSAITSLIKVGAKTLVVPGNFPIGCSPSYLTIYQSKNKNDYEPSGCLKWLNELVQYQNNLLQMDLKRLRTIYPHAKIVYADYYNLFFKKVRVGKEAGIQERLPTCCGGGGPYNYNLTSNCGSPGSKTCLYQSKYMQWDGIHLTEAAYRYIGMKIYLSLP